MKLKYENFLYLKWIFKNFYRISIYFFYFKKIKNKIFLIKKYKKYKKFININISKNDCNFNNFSNDLYNLNTINYSNISIKLASHLYKIDHGIEWTKQFFDSEDTECLHRFNWALFSISAKSVNNNLISLIISEENNWNRLFLNKINKQKLMWEPYTVSERITNLLLFHFIYDIKITNSQLNSYILQINFLINNLEFHKSCTGNHYFNNLRALYICASIFKINRIEQLLHLEIKKQLIHLTKEDFFLREGSSHYHFLFTRWVLEIYFFAIFSHDNSLSKTIEIYLIKLIDRVNFFNVTYQDNINFPLIGDISPDFDPNWLKNIPYILNKEDSIVNNIHSYSWNRLWKNLISKKKLSLSFDNYNYNKSFLITEFPKSGWFRYSFQEFTLFIRLKSKSISDYVGHSHNDQAHFCLYYKGKQIFVDNGRSTYNVKDDISYKSIEAKNHNTFLLNKIPIVPNNKNYFPEIYYQSNNKIYSKKINDTLLITLTSDAYQRLSNQIYFKRKFIIKKNQLDIIDKIYTDKILDYESFFYFHPDTKIIENNNLFSFLFSNLPFVFEYNKDINSFFLNDSNEHSYSEFYGQTLNSNKIFFKKKIFGTNEIKYTLRIK